ncbi:MAG: hypothetical protein QM541_09310 [Flavobacterium sp.]|nr:hypothetical protein [Flavobacterium sp.]
MEPIEKRKINSILSENFSQQSFVTFPFELKTFNEEQLQILAKQTKRILKNGGQLSFIKVSKPNKSLPKKWSTYFSA